MAISIKKSVFLAAFSFFGSFLFSQNEGKKSPRFGGFGNEIAVFPLSILYFGDGNGSFQNGASLVFKHQVLPFRGRKWKRTASMRFCGGFFREQYDFEYLTQGIGIIVSPGSPPPNLDPVQKIVQRSKTSKNHRVAQIGFEFRWQKKRFGHWLGADFGYRWGSGITENTTAELKNGAETEIFSNHTDESFYAPGAAAFWGCRFFLLKRLSLGFEVSLPIEYEFSKSITTAPASVSPAPTTFLTEFWEYPFSRPRFLFLAFHF